MKIKTDFITNSSSSSFVVINAKNGYFIPDYGVTLLAGSNIGDTQFGWGPYAIFGVGSRINFAYLQTTYAENKEWLEMLEKVIKENTGVTEILWNITREYIPVDYMDWGYIDHASSALDGANTQIFDSEDVLKDFLFGNGSHIVLDNDNH